MELWLLEVQGVARSQHKHFQSNRCVQGVINTKGAHLTWRILCATWVSSFLILWPSSSTR